MQVPTVSLHDTSMLALIGWLYLITNATRVFSYIPQIVVVWRCLDGARSVSLFTWWSWVVSHVTAVTYGVVVVVDAYFVTISVVNLVGCGAVAVLAALRRHQWRRLRCASACE